MPNKTSTNTRLPLAIVLFAGAVSCVAGLCSEQTMTTTPVRFVFHGKQPNPSDATRAVLSTAADEFSIEVTDVEPGADRVIVHASIEGDTELVHEASERFATAVTEGVAARSLDDSHRQQLLYELDTALADLNATENSAASANSTAEEKRRLLATRTSLLVGKGLLWEAAIAIGEPTIARQRRSATPLGLVILVLVLVPAGVSLLWRHRPAKIDDEVGAAAVLSMPTRVAAVELAPVRVSEAA